MERRVIFFEDVREGGEVPPFMVERLTRMDLVRYAGASGDFNPIHTDEEFARAAGNPSVFGHGMLTAAFVGKCVTDYVGAENLRRYKVRFATRVWPGDSVTCKGKVTKKTVEKGEKIIEGEITALNQKGEVAIQGSFRAALNGDLALLVEGRDLTFDDLFPLLHCLLGHLPFAGHRVTGPHPGGKAHFV